MVTIPSRGDERAGGGGAEEEEADKAGGAGVEGEEFSPPSPLDCALLLSLSRGRFVLVLLFLSILLYLGLLFGFLCGVAVFLWGRKGE